MTPDEYLMWMELQRELEEKKGEGGFCELKVGELLPIMPRNLFEVISKKAWTDVLLQLLKVIYTDLQIYPSSGLNHLVVHKWLS